MAAAEDIELLIYIRGPRGLTKVKAGDKYKFTEVGSYEVIYFATDNWDNVSRVTYNFTVGA